LKDYRLNERKSLERAEISKGHLEKYFTGIRVTEITTPKVQAYIEHRMEQDAKNGTINRELAVLKRMLNLGARQTPPKVDRVPYIQKLRENNVRKGFFEHDQYLALLKALPAHLRPVTTFAYRPAGGKLKSLG
jgi:site-specific recombinase XerD